MGVLADMSGYPLLLLVLASLARAGAQGQGSGPGDTSTCCSKREVRGSHSQSGLYLLAEETDLRCKDGCLYQKSDSNQTSFCFQHSAQRVTTCSGGEEEAVETTTTTTTTNTTTTTTSTTTTSTTAVETINISAFWGVQTSLELKSVTMRGEWGPDEFCPVGSYATAFQLYLAPLCKKRCNSDDDVGLMGSKLICAAYDDTTTTTAEVTSSVTDDFTRVGGGRSLGYAWKTVHACPANYFLSSSRYLSELFILDDGAGGTSNFTCPEGVICGGLTGSTSTTSTDPAGGLNMAMSAQTQLSPRWREMVLGRR